MKYLFASLSLSEGKFKYTFFHKQFYYIRDIFSRRSHLIVRLFENLLITRSHVYKVAAFYLSRIPESYFRS